MGLFDFLKKKEIGFLPGKDYYFDILDDAKRIKVDNSEHGFVLDSYYNTPQLASIINYSAKVASRNDLRYYNEQGDQQESDILELFKDPHPLYSEGEFWETYFKQFDLFNIVLTYKVQGVGGKVSGLFILPYQSINIVPIKGLKPTDILLAQDIKEVISHYELAYKNKKYSIPVEDVWMVSGTSLKFDQDGYLKPDNIIDTLKYPIKNIQANYEARYSLVENRGQVGIWVNKSTDSGSYVPLKEDDKKNVRNTLRRTFGLTKGRDIIGFTDADLKFESATLPIKDMELTQGIQQDKITLCDAFSFPILLLNELTGSTYSNLDIADRNLYTKKTIPTWEIIAKSITKEFIDTGYFDFYIGDIEVLQKDDKVKAETNQINTATIISLNNAVMTGVIGYDQAIQTLISIADISEQVAKEVITEKSKDNEQL